MIGIVLTLLAIFLAICFALHHADHPPDSCLQAIIDIKRKKDSKR